MEHLQGTLTERLCRLGAAALYHLDGLSGESSVRHAVAIRDVMQAAKDLELRPSSCADMRRGPGLEVDLDESESNCAYYAAIIRIERGSGLDHIDYARGHQFAGNEAVVLECAPESAHMAALRLAEKLARGADDDDREAAQDHGEP